MRSEELKLFELMRVDSFRGGPLPRFNVGINRSCSPFQRRTGRRRPPLNKRTNTNKAQDIGCSTYRSAVVGQKAGSGKTIVMIDHRGACP
jgi:hypothetical protein